MFNRLNMFGRLRTSTKTTILAVTAQERLFPNVHHSDHAKTMNSSSPPRGPGSLRSTLSVYQENARNLTHHVCGRARQSLLPLAQCPSATCHCLRATFKTPETPCAPLMEMCENKPKSYRNRIPRAGCDNGRLTSSRRTRAKRNHRKNTIVSPDKPRNKKCNPASRHEQYARKRRKRQTMRQRCSSGPCLRRRALALSATKAKREMGAQRITSSAKRVPPGQ